MLKFIKTMSQTLHVFNYKIINLPILTCFYSSVRVIHDVVLAISNNASSEDLYEDNFKAVEEAVGELVDCIDGKTHTQFIHN